MSSHARQMLVLFGMLASILLIAFPVNADEVAQSGRAVAAKWKDTVVTIKVAGKVNMSYKGESQDEDFKQEVTGVTIDPSGLVIVSLVTVDPVEAFSEGGREDPDMKITADISTVTIRLADGTELPGKIILRDKDLDLAFIRPLKQPDKPIVSLDFTHVGQPDILDQIFILYRLGTNANRTLNITVDRIEAAIEKPRKLYVPGIAGTAAENGAPVFTMEGNLVGFLLRKAPVKGSDDQLFVIMPAVDVLDAAKQAPATTDEVK